MIKVLLPGFGGSFQSIEVGSTDTAIDTDLDMSHCGSFAVQIQKTEDTLSGTFQIQQSFDGTGWADYGSAVTATDGTIARFDITDKPFGLLRVNPSGITGGSCVFTIVGFRESNQI